MFFKNHIQIDLVKLNFASYMKNLKFSLNNHINIQTMDPQALCNDIENDDDNNDDLLFFCGIK